MENKSKERRRKCFADHARTWLVQRPYVDWSTPGRDLSGARAWATVLETRFFGCFIGYVFLACSLSPILMRSVSLSPRVDLGLFFLNLLGF